MDALAGRETEACGGGPTAAAMIAARILGAERCAVLDYAHSGDVTGDTSSVVGYVSAALIGSTKSGAKKEHPENGAARSEKRGDEVPDPTNGTETDLTAGDKTYLLTLARSVIVAECEGESATIDPPPSPVLGELRGGFVTLKKRGRLRGCIGYIKAFKPLVETVTEMAKAAAFNDPRFSPVTAGEIMEIDIEISVLSPIKRIDDPSVIEVGTHGIIISRGPQQGLLLPQVATEWGWDREKFLEQTCLKAGLPVDAWKQPGTRIDIFSADIFSEIEMGLR
jgi:AmmeMemoRadiSam system protein A